MIDMKEALEKLCDKAMNAEKSEDALRFSQAANNLANTNACVVNTEQLTKW